MLFYYSRNASVFVSTAKRILAKNLLILAMLVFIIISIAFPGLSRAAIQEGAVDPTFKSGAGPNGSVNSVAVQSDGKIIIAGSFTTYNSSVRNHLARLNLDGSLDESFNLGSGSNDNLNSVVVQNDGKILIGGFFSSYNGVGHNRIARLNSDGTLDPTFNYYETPFGLYTIAVQNDGKILIGGLGGYSQSNIAIPFLSRLNSDGSNDSSFTANLINIDRGRTAIVYSVVVQSDGKILVGGEFEYHTGVYRYNLARTNADGSWDTTFDIGNDSMAQRVYSMAVQNDGKILVGGITSHHNGLEVRGLVRLNKDGSQDSSFNFTSSVAETESIFWINSIVLQNDGKILVGGWFTLNNSTNRKNIARLNGDGSLDSSFSLGSGATGNAQSQVKSVVLQSDGKILIGGDFINYNSTPANRLARLSITGTLDNSLNPGNASGADLHVYAVAVQNDGKILIGGWFTSYNGKPRNHIARLNSDGDLDNSFNPGSGPDEIIYNLTTQSDGKILIGGSFSSYNGVPRSGVARLNSDGSLDNSFNPGIGAISNSYTNLNFIVVQSDGKILIGGSFSSYNGVPRSGIARLNSDGSLDNSFNPGNGVAGSYYTVSSLAIQADGKILIGGKFTSYNGISRSNVARLNADGSLDTSFDIVAGFDKNVSALAVQNDGKIVVTGEFGSYNSVVRSRIARLNSDGSLDSSFNPGSGADNTISSFAIQSDGKIVIGGEFTNYNGTPRLGIARSNQDGTSDATFKPGIGANGHVYQVVVQSDDKIIIGGAFTSVDTYTRNYLARLEGTNKAVSTLTVNSNPQPSNLGETVTFTAIITPQTATGAIKFNFGNGASVTSTLTNGVATYVTNTLPAGLTYVRAIYEGNSETFPASTPTYTHGVSVACSSGVDPLIVTNSTDDGHATACGSFSYALLAADSGATIKFGLSSGNTITFNAGLTALLKAGVNIEGGEGITLDGNRVEGDGLRLSGNNTLSHLTIRHFGGRELVITPGASSNRLYLVKLEG